jgi:hypothetical protein
MKSKNLVRGIAIAGILAIVLGALLPTLTAFQF